MKTLKMYCWHLATLALLLVSYSCKQEASDIGGVTDKIPENVILWTYSTSTITVAWDPVEGATSYTVQLLASKDSDEPIDAYTTTSKDFYQFSGLRETRGYYVRVRANVDYATGNWVYIMNGSEPGRIMPKYGFVDEDYEEPEPEPTIELQLYPNFPEGWEVHADEANRKRGYPGESDTYPSGRWLMPNMYAHNVTAIENKVGNWAIMMRNGHDPYLAMDFDLPYGARKFSFVYAAATKSNSIDTGGVPFSLKVEYSQDSGEHWFPLGDDLVVTTVDDQYFKEYDLNIEGAVRFRIGKYTAGGRPIIDEIAVYY